MLNTTGNGNTKKNALILSGGGARAAYQVGVLKAIAELLPDNSKNPFPIISGTSAGAINTAALAIYGKCYQHAIKRLLIVWTNFHVHHVFRTDIRGALKNSGRWFISLFLSGTDHHKPVSLFDRTPLLNILNKYLPCERITESLNSGIIESICITASSYNTGKSISFYHSLKNIEPWTRARRIGRSGTITAQHLMASSAIPLIFNAVKLGNDYFGDGSMRQTAPLSPAIHLGANNLLVIGVTNEPDTTTDEDTEAESPTMARIGSHILNSIFIDSMEADLERVQRINKTLELIPTDEMENDDISLTSVNVLVIDPSQDLQKISTKHILSLPKSLRFLLRMIGALDHQGSSLVSYLMFEKSYCNELIDLGYNDAMERKQELMDFLGLGIRLE